MKQLFGIVLVILIVIGVLGFYRGWFNVETDRGGDKTKIEINVDEKKIKEDEEKAKQKADELSKDVKQKVHDATKK